MGDNRMGAWSGWPAGIWILTMLAVATPAGAETLRGTVLDKEGRPAGGAIV